MNRYFIGYVVATSNFTEWSANTIIVQHGKLTFQQVEQLEKTLKEEIDVELKSLYKKRALGPEPYVDYVKVISIYRFEEE